MESAGRVASPLARERGRVRVDSGAWGCKREPLTSVLFFLVQGERLVKIATSPFRPTNQQILPHGLIIMRGCQNTFFVYNRRFVMAESTETVSLKEFQLHDKDTGSADVQVALLTRRIEHLTEHLKINRKDHSSRRGLLKMVAQRRSLLDYLSKTKADRYKKLIDKLNLRK